CPRTSVHDVPGLYRERVRVRARALPIQMLSLCRIFPAQHGKNESSTYTYGAKHQFVIESRFILVLLDHKER
ncbi:hypothetical protein, partial [Serratia fonticola]|uniref:hypothetical protein n=1 Tax=Serratia fonticola TaxID=47917 RepID=UPI001C0EC907